MKADGGALRRRAEEKHVEKKQTETPAKKRAKAKLKLRKITVRDLDARKADEVKGGPESARMRCF
jgi:hypothetical protein